MQRVIQVMDFGIMVSMNIALIHIDKNEISRLEDGFIL